MVVSYRHESVRLTGRWDVSNPACAVTTATGSYIEFAFYGKMAVAHFDVSMNANPRLHLWILVDDGAMIEAPIDSHLRIIAPEDGHHVCKIIYKGGVEQERRWFAPLTGKVTFLGITTEQPEPIPADNRKIVEFVGDSITEGVLIDVDFYEGGTPESYIDQMNRSFQDDACATYAWLTAKALNLRPVIMGYGGVGVTRPGCGAVPAAVQAYPFNFDGSPIAKEVPDYIVLNHGCNDRRVAEPEKIRACYYEMFQVLRRHNPRAVLVALTPFIGGVTTAAMSEAVEQFNRDTGDHVHLIDSAGWISPSPVHPLRAGHRAIADHLIPILKEIFQ